MPRTVHTPSTDKKPRGKGDASPFCPSSESFACGLKGGKSGEDRPEMKNDLAGSRDRAILYLSLQMVALRIIVAKRIGAGDRAPRVTLLAKRKRLRANVAK